MKGNDKIAFTAEAVALFRDYLHSDRFSKYFPSPEVQRKFKLLRFVAPSYLDKLARSRVALSSDLDKLIVSYKPEQIVELACGYSTRGLLMTQRNPNLVYLDTDFSDVIQRKRKILSEISVAEEIKLSPNYHLMEFDALSGNLNEVVKKLLSKRKRTLVIAETLNSYLDPGAFDLSVKSIEELLKNVSDGAYVSNEAGNMTPGLFGRLLILYRNRRAKTERYRHFTNKQGIRDYFLRCGFQKVDVVDSPASNNMLYLATWK